MKETLSLITADQYAKVTAETFGHLAPKSSKVYNGWILFTLTAFGDTCIIDFEFKDLDASPWFNCDVLDYISDYTDKIKDKPFGVFLFKGSYIKYRKGKFDFSGNIKEIECLKTINNE